jgi:type VI secretion system secreted protein Hcp
MARNLYIHFPKHAPLKGDAKGDEMKGKDAIEILDVSHGVSMPLSGATAGGQARHSGRAEFQDMTFTKYVDATSPHLVSFCAGGNIIPTAVISHFVASQKDATSTPILSHETTISDVIVTSYSLSWGGHDLPVESISLNFGKIQWSKKEMDNTSKGKAPAAVTTSWDLALNKKG